jgi:DNA-binding PadR family transcriptional regulator
VGTPAVSARNGKSEALQMNPTSALLRTLLLSRLAQSDNYPTGLARQLTAEGVPLDAAQASTLMAQLQVDGLAESKWVFDSGTRPRRWYTMTKRGHQELAAIVTHTIVMYQQILALLQA